MSSVSTVRLSRQDYFDAAFEVLAEGDYRQLTIARLCDRLGVSKGSFYHHFDGWPGFVQALLSHWEEERTLRVAALAASVGTKRDRSRLLNAMVTGLPHDVEAAIRVWSRNEPIARSVQLRVDDERVAMMADLLSSHLEPKDAQELAELFHTVLVGAQMSSHPVPPRRIRMAMNRLAELVAAQYGPELLDL